MFKTSIPLVGLFISLIALAPASLEAQNSRTNNASFVFDDTPACRRICAQVSQACMTRCHGRIEGENGGMQESIAVVAQAPGQEADEEGFNEGHHHPTANRRFDSEMSGQLQEPATIPTRRSPTLGTLAPSVGAPQSATAEVEESAQETAGNTAAKEAERRAKLPQQYEECLADRRNSKTECSKAYVACRDAPDCRSVGEARAELDAQARRSHIDTHNQAVVACEAAHKSAKRWCDAKPMAAGVTALVAMFTQSRQSNDMEKACASASKLAMASMGANTTLSLQCDRAASSCVKTCRSASNVFDGDGDHGLPGDSGSEELKRECYDLQAGAMAIKDQIMKDAAVYAQTKTCSDIAKAFGDCASDKGYDNPKCPQYCQSPTHMREEICNTDPCSLPANKNTLACYCQSNPGDPQRCGGFVAGTLPGTTSAGLGIAPGTRASLGSTPGFDLGDDDGDDQVYEGGPAGAVKPTGVNYGDNGGGAPGGGGGGLGGNMGAGGKGKQDGPYNTDIVKSYGSGAGGGTYGGGGGGYGTASNGNGGYGRERNEPGFDPRKYMPKMGDNKRGPASISAELFNNGITAANGLSNFEKVTKKMNEKRTQLLP